MKNYLNGSITDAAGRRRCAFVDFWRQLLYNNPAKTKDDLRLCAENGEQNGPSLCV